MKVQMMVETGEFCAMFPSIPWEAEGCTIPGTQTQALLATALEIVSTAGKTRQLNIQTLSLFINPSPETPFKW